MSAINCFNQLYQSYANITCAPKGNDSWKNSERTECKIMRLEGTQVVQKLFCIVLERYSWYSLVLLIYYLVSRIRHRNRCAVKKRKKKKKQVAACYVIIPQRNLDIYRESCVGSTIFKLFSPHSCDCYIPSSTGPHAVKRCGWRFSRSRLCSML